MTDRRCSNTRCQTWTPEAQLRHGLCLRCVKILRATGSWCEEHGALLLGQACLGCAQFSTMLSEGLSTITGGTR